jgi:hypothetical protein
MKKQRNTLISYILFYGGFFLIFTSITIILIYTLVFKNYEGDYVHLLCFIFCLIGIVMPFFASDFNLYYYFAMYKPEYKMMKAFRNNSNKGFIQGVPNNNCFEFLALDIINCTQLELINEKGIYKGNYNGQSIKLDMKGWIFKNKYVYELIQSYFVIQYLKKHKLPLKYIYKKIINNDINAVNLILKNGNKTKIYKLASKGVINIKLSLKIKNKNKYRFIVAKNYSINDFYSFNKK